MPFSIQYVLPTVRGSVDVMTVNAAKSSTTGALLAGATGGIMGIFIINLSDLVGGL